MEEVKKDKKPTTHRRKASGLCKRGVGGKMGEGEKFLKRAKITKV